MIRLEQGACGEGLVMDETATRDALLTAVQIGREHGGMLLVLDAAPIHSLWIARHLHLLVEIDLTVIIPESIRGIFAAHQDCRKGREVLAFLDRHTPPLVISSGGPEALYGLLEGGQEAGGARPAVALVGSCADWQASGALEHVRFVDVQDLAVVAEKVGLLESVIDIAHAIELPGEIAVWR